MVSNIECTSRTGQDLDSDDASERSAVLKVMLNTKRHGGRSSLLLS